VESSEFKSIEGVDEVISTGTFARNVRMNNNIYLSHLTTADSTSRELPPAIITKSPGSQSN